MVIAGLRPIGELTGIPVPFADSLDTLQPLQTPHSSPTMPDPEPGTETTFGPVLSV